VTRRSPQKSEVNLESSSLFTCNESYSLESTTATTMSDPFFAKDNKRKRPAQKGAPPKAYEKPFRPSAYGKGQKSGANVDGKRRSTARDEDLASDNEDAGGRGADVDDMDLMTDRFGEQAEYDSAEEEDRNRNETAAAKRLRLAKGYLEKVRSEVQGESLPLKGWSDQLNSRTSRRRELGRGGYR
jgi:hypothetical protein